MTVDLLLPPQAAGALAKLLKKHWADAVCAELGVSGIQAPAFSVRLRRKVNSVATWEGLDFDARYRWQEAWQACAVPAGSRVDYRPVSKAKESQALPLALHCSDLDACLRYIRAFRGTGDLPEHDIAASASASASALALAPDAGAIDEARGIGRRVLASGGRLTPAALRKLTDMSQDVRDMALAAVEWLGKNPDISQYTERQLPIPKLHTKWLRDNGGLIRQLTGRDIRQEVRPRLAVVNMTYLDPDYLEVHRHRRHDSWTQCDPHEPAYLPQTVIIVENRDSRLWFPPVPHAIALEGGGLSAAEVIPQVSWLGQASTVAYWGDIDAEGFAILSGLRAALDQEGITLQSILMDGVTLAQFAGLATVTDARGVRLDSHQRQLANLTDAEAEAYSTVATSGPSSVRRIEQEKLPASLARSRLLDLIPG